MQHQDMTESRQEAAIFFFIVCKDKSEEERYKEARLKATHSDVHHLCY